MGELLQVHKLCTKKCRILLGMFESLKWKNSVKWLRVLVRWTWVWSPKPMVWDNFRQVTEYKSKYFFPSRIRIKYLLHWMRCRSMTHGSRNCCHYHFCYYFIWQLLLFIGAGDFFHQRKGKSLILQWETWFSVKIC